ncbi:hypothetical protein TNCV_3139251 [Trichonephila clavipes]|nr:hypothetical protein TNCV_3139251 [Trichonephila clavipes]
MAVYGDIWVWKATVTRMFGDGRHKIRDLPRSSKALKVVTEKLIMDINNAMKGNLCQNIHDIANEIYVFIGTIHNIVANILKYRNVCCEWVPRMLSEPHKKTANGAEITPFVAL